MLPLHPGGGGWKSGIAPMSNLSPVPELLSLLPTELSSVPVDNEPVFRR